MRNLLILPILFITCFCLAQDAKEIIGKPITIGNLLVAQNDFPDQMGWVYAKKACESLGNGWRLPTKNELNELYKNKAKIGVFWDELYWSSSKVNSNEVWTQDFGIGGQNFIGHKKIASFARAVKSL